MTKRTIAVVSLLLLLFAGCGKEMEIGVTTYETKGAFTMGEMDPCVKYEVIVGNVIWGIILVETIFAPVYFFGFSLWEPVGLKAGCAIPAPAVPK